MLLLIHADFKWNSPKNQECRLAKPLNRGIPQPEIGRSLIDWKKRTLHSLWETNARNIFIEFHALSQIRTQLQERIDFLNGLVLECEIMNMAVPTKLTDDLDTFTNQMNSATERLFILQCSGAFGQCSAREKELADVLEVNRFLVPNAKAVPLSVITVLTMPEVSWTVQKESSGFLTIRLKAQAIADASRMEDLD